MAGRIFFQLLQTHSSLLSPKLLNSWGCFSRQAFSTAQRLESSTVKSSLNNTGTQAHNNKIPTYQQIKNDPELQRKLAEMYKSQEKEPDIQKITIESIKWGLRSLGKD